MEWVMAVAAPTEVTFDVNAADRAIGVRPATAVQLMRLATDDSATAEQIQQVIDADPSMALRTLRLANSAAYGLSNKVSRIERAVALLGRMTIAKLASSASVEGAFGGFKIAAPGITGDTPWRYAVCVGFATEVVIGECHTMSSVAQRKLAAEAFVAGLIHDIGTLVQAKMSQEKFNQAVTGSLKSGVPLVSHERRLIGIDHAQIGERLAVHWSLPPELAGAIGLHHDPLSAKPEHRTLTCIIHVAAQLVRKAGVAALDGDTDMPQLGPAMEQLRLDPRKTDRLVQAIADRVKTIEI